MQKTPELTNQEIARIFALYYGCNYSIHKTKSGIFVAEKVDCNIIKDIEEHDNNRVEKLLLRNLTDLTTEEMFELCKMVGESEFGDYRFSKWEVSKYKKWTKDLKNYQICNEKANFIFHIDAIDGIIEIYETEDGKTPMNRVPSLYQTYWQWYLKNGFAIPLWPWRMNAFELNIAIDISGEATVDKSFLNKTEPLL